MPRQEQQGRSPFSVSEIAALVKVFEAHRTGLLAMLARRIDPALERRVDPEDILSEVFLRARLRWSDRDHAASSTYAWLYRIALDCLIDAWRSAHTAGRSIGKEVAWPERSSMELGMGLVGSVTSPSEAFARNELKERIKFAIDQLKPEDREILGMRHFDELSFGEAGTVLGIGEDAAAKRYARALRRLRRLWSRIGPDGGSDPRGGP